MLPDPRFLSRDARSMICSQVRRTMPERNYRHNRKSSQETKIHGSCGTNMHKKMKIIQEKKQKFVFATTDNDII